jgi:hypothetical protein
MVTPVSGFLRLWNLNSDGTLTYVTGPGPANAAVAPAG